MELIRFLMTKKDYNKIVAIEKAIEEKYGKEAIITPDSNWSEEKEKEYLKQLKLVHKQSQQKKEWQEKIDVNGVKVSKKLLNRESLKNCPVCGSFTRSVKDDVSLIKFDCCYKCFIQYVEDREERWLKGWRPQ